MDDIERLTKIATMFRAAIVATDHLPGFPAEKCCASCGLLGLHLHDLGYRDIVIMTGDRPDYPTDVMLKDSKHVWLQVDGVTIDITADQFGNEYEKIIVKRDSPQHVVLNGKSEKFNHVRRREIRDAFPPQRLWEMVSGNVTWANE